HSDDRFRAGRRTQRREEFSRRDFSSLLAPLSSHPDDHHGGHAGGFSSRFWDRNRFGIKAAARDYDRRRPDFQPVAYFVHHTSGISLYGSSSVLVGPHR